MIVRVALLAVIFATGAAAQTDPAAVPPPVPAAAPEPAGPPPPGTGEVRVKLVTGDGTITIDLDRAHAPLTTANFLKYVDQHRFDGTSFYRADVVDKASGLGLIQGGVKGDPKRILPPVAHEPTTKTGLAHVEGTISMARLAPGTARGDFFITTGPLSSLDAHPQAAGDNVGFAAFGHVVAGMDVVHHILDAPIGPGGEGAMRGQMLAKPVRIVTVRRSG
jgi:peptidyl-prolyl cis-trans isomerase A (cyclophilin A)